MEFIYSRKSHASARVNRWVLRLQPYSFVVKHIPGKMNIADSPSRLTSKTTEPDSKTERSMYVMLQKVPHLKPCLLEKKKKHPLLIQSYLI